MSRQQSSLLYFVMSFNNCLLLLSFITLSAGMSMPNSDLPFEFNHKKGHVGTAKDVMVQSVSSDGSNTDSSANQSKKYHTQNKMNTVQYTDPNEKGMKTYVQNPHRTQHGINHAINEFYGLRPSPHIITSSTNIQTNNLFEAMKNILPGNFRIVYV